MRIWENKKIVWVIDIGLVSIVGIVLTWGLEVVLILVFLVDHAGCVKRGYIQRYGDMEGHIVLLV